MRENLINVEGLNFKETIVKLFQIIGPGEVTMEYPELKEYEVTVSIDKKK